MIARMAKGVSLAGLMVAMLAGSALADGLVLTGEIAYRERIALPDNATALIQLVDVSLADAPAKVISAQTISPAGQVPIRFALPFEASDIEARNRYAVQARIEVDGQLWFINDTHIGVEPLTHTGALSIPLIHTAGHDTAPTDAPESDDAASASPLAGSDWLLTAIGGQPAAEGVETTLVFGADGSLGGNGGCNSYGGSVAVSDGADISISDVFSTMMACPEPQMGQEGAFFAALMEAERYSVDGAVLTLWGADEIALLELTAR